MDTKLIDMSTSLVNLISAIIVLLSVVSTFKQMKRNKAATTDNPQTSIKYKELPFVSTTLFFFGFVLIAFLNSAQWGSLCFILGFLISLILFPLNQSAPTRFEIINLTVGVGGIVFFVLYSIIDKIISLIEKMIRML